jgi:hypothetical protein
MNVQYIIKENNREWLRASKSLQKSLKFKNDMDEIYPGGLERLAVNAKVATVLGSVTASDTMDLRGGR